MYSIGVESPCIQELPIRNEYVWGWRYKGSRHKHCTRRTKTECTQLRSRLCGKPSFDSAQCDRQAVHDLLLAPPECRKVGGLIGSCDAYHMGAEGLGNELANLGHYDS